MQKWPVAKYDNMSPYLSGNITCINYDAFSHEPQSVRGLLLLQ